MGLDWHSAIPGTLAERIAQAKEYLEKPLDLIGREKAWDAGKALFGGPKMSRETYKKQLRPDEQVLRGAIHWFRTAAKGGVHLSVST